MLKDRDKAIIEIEQALADRDFLLYEELKNKYWFQELWENNY